MKVSDVLLGIDYFYPFLTAADFDNVGLLIGDRDAEVGSAVVSLDCTMNTVKFAIEKGANLIVTHHPVIFDPLKNLLAGTVAFECVKHSINVISAHTNLDTGKNGLNDKICDLLGVAKRDALFIDDFLLRKATLREPMTAADLAALCKKTFGGNVRYTDGGHLVSTVAICSGGGGSFFDSVMASGVDAYISGDIKHSQFISAANRGFTVFDCGHFDTENVIVEPFAEFLKNRCPDITFLPYHGTEIKSA